MASQGGFNKVVLTRLIMTELPDYAPAKSAGITSKIEEALCTEVSNKQWVVGKTNPDMAAWLGLGNSTYERMKGENPQAPGWPTIFRLCAFFGAEFTAKVFEPLFNVAGLEVRPKQESKISDELMNKLRPHIEQYLKETVGGGE